MAAYRAYHQAIIVAKTVSGLTTSSEYRELLRKAAELDPAFTRPLALLVGSYALEVFGNQDPAHIEDAEALLATLRELAPDSADFLIAQTYYTYYILRDYALALQIANQALDIVPSDTQLVAITAWIKRRQGDYPGYLEAMRLARQLEPSNDSWAEGIVGNLIITHQYDEALAEIETYARRNYYIEQAGATLAVREHGDLSRLAEGTENLANEIGEGNYVWDIWQTRFDARDFEGAKKALDSIPRRREGAGIGNGISGFQATSIETYWAMGDADRLAELVADARKTIARAGTDEALFNSRTTLSIALLEAVEGNSEEAERQIRNWYRNSKQDLTERAVMWNLACRTLGIAGVAEAAVACIRKGLEQPSEVMPFIEPHLPYYDTIRTEPVFVELLEQLGS